MTASYSVVGISSLRLAPVPSSTPKKWIASSTSRSPPTTGSLFAATSCMGCEASRKACSGNKPFRIRLTSAPVSSSAIAWQPSSFSSSLCKTTATRRCGSSSPVGGRLCRPLPFIRTPPLKRPTSGVMVSGCAICLTLSLSSSTTSFARGWLSLSFIWSPEPDPVKGADGLSNVRTFVSTPAALSGTLRFVSILSQIGAGLSG